MTATADYVKYELITSTKKARATGITDTNYVGAIKIKENVEISGNTYTVDSVGPLAFYKCKITSIELPNSLIRIENNAFDVNPSLTGTLKIAQNVEFLGAHAFASTRFEYIVIPLSLKTITPSAFCANTALKGFIIDFEHKYYSVDKYKSLYNKNQTYLIQYPNSLKFFRLAPTTIGLTYKSCSKLSAKKIYVPKGVVYLESNAFEYMDSDIYILADWFIPSKNTFFKITGKIFIYSRIEITEKALNEASKVYVSNSYPGTQFGGFNITEKLNLKIPKFDICSQFNKCKTKSISYLFAYVMLVVS